MSGSTQRLNRAVVLVFQSVSEDVGYEQLGSDKFKYMTYVMVQGMVALTKHVFVVLLLGLQKSYSQKR